MLKLFEDLDKRKSQIDLALSPHLEGANRAMDVSAGFGGTRAEEHVTAYELKFDLKHFNEHAYRPASLKIGDLGLEPSGMGGQAIRFSSEQLFEGAMLADGFLADPHTLVERMHAILTDAATARAPKDDVGGDVTDDAKSDDE